MESTKISLEAVLNKRTVIPRWKPPQLAVETDTSDKKRLFSRSKLGAYWIKYLESEFQLFPTESTAIELFETASIYGSLENLPPNVRKLSKKIQSKSDNITSTSNQNISSHMRLPLVLGEPVDTHEMLARQEINRLRRLLAENTGRPFCWSELSRNYLVVGEKEKATRSMNAALQLAKHNRYLCRAATRLFVHVDDKDRALHILRTEPAIKSDPWLLAAEIATSTVSQKQSKLIDVGRRLITSNQFNGNQLSELAAALGTVELMNGSIKHAKSMFQASLIAPTDNSLAQAQWAVDQDTKIVIPDSAWQTPDSCEAKTLASRQAHDWENAIRTCILWLADEPFSIRPAMLGSYLCFRPEHVGIAEQFATAGLRCNNANKMLLNNRAVARVYQGKISEAYKDIKIALQDNEARDDAHLLATLGLTAFRSGKPELGREYYQLSIGWFSHLKERASVASAMLYWLREEIRINKLAIPQSIEIAQRISKMPIAMKHPELFGMAQLLLEETSADANSSSDIHGSSEFETPKQEDFFHCAALFDVPEKAKQIASRMEISAELD